MVILSGYECGPILGSASEAGWSTRVAAIDGGADSSPAADREAGRFSRCWQGDRVGSLQRAPVH